MNKMGFGFMRLPKIEGSEEYDFENGKAMADAFLERGSTHFDTAWTYLGGESERAIGECVVKRHPREAFTVSSKLPGYRCETYEDAYQYLEESLSRCALDYFDVYLIHWLNKEHYEIAERLEQFRFLTEIKKEGKARRIGFSYHDNAELLDEILTAHPEVDVVLLQINYVDWETAGIESGKCYETCVKHGKSVFVMEPNKGGTLIHPPAEVEDLFRAAHPDWSNADWAIRFVQSLPQVEVCLSGMTSPEEVAANLKDIEPLTEEEKALLARAADLIRGKTAVACTTCRYCVEHCPMGIAIPDYFKLYNEVCRYPGEAWKLRPVYGHLAETNGKASACIGCGACQEHCPQRLPIPELMPKVAEKLEG